jgi:sugar lactone lactonase YvrE
MVKGTAKGVAIRNNGELQLAPVFESLYTTPSTYIWAIASDEAGNLYAAAGSPARVYRVTPSGQPAVIFEPKELQVQALLEGRNGVLYAATSPDGKVYKLERKKNAGGDERANWDATVYFDPDTKYIWSMVEDNGGNLYVATGDRGEIYRVTSKGEHAVFFKSDEPHIRVLAMDGQGNLIAGSDGSGLVYRISAAGEAFVLYSAPKKEITALAIDSTGNIYAAGVGEKRSSPNTGITAPLPVPTPAPAASAPQPQPGSVIITSTATAPVPSIPFPAPGAGSTGGSEVYRISPDGSPTKLWTSREDIVYALAFDHQGTLLAGTGNRGHIYAITGNDDFSDLLKASASQVTGFAKAPAGGLYVSTSNLGKLFLLGSGPQSEGAYESDVFDAHIFSRWGRAEFRGTGTVELFARSGNVDNPDRNWSSWKRVELSKDAMIEVPPARFVQWKAVLHSGSPAPSVRSVLLNYLPKNVAPVIEDVTVQTGVRYPTIPKGSPDTAGQAHYDSPVAPVHDRDSIGVKWSAHDDNDDQLVYSVYYRAQGTSRWILLKDDLTDKYYSLDSSLLPDGGYIIKVVSSDAPSHSPGEGLLSNEKESARFEIDSTAPQISGLVASIEGGQVHVAFKAADSFSPIKRAEYSIDAADWQFVEPVGQLSDSKMENYDFRAAVPVATPVMPGARQAGATADTTEHVVVVRVYDRYDNMNAAKTVTPEK